MSNDVEPNEVLEEEALELPSDPDALIDENQLSKLTGISLSKLRNDRYMKRGFPYIKIGALARYQVGDYRRTIKELKVQMSD